MFEEGKDLGDFHKWVQIIYLENLPSTFPQPEEARQGAQRVKERGSSRRTVTFNIATTL